MSRTVNLDINDSGSWRRVTSFDLDALGEGHLEYLVEELLRESTNDKIKARLIIPGDVAPLVDWTKSDGWRVWGAVG